MGGTQTLCTVRVLSDMLRIPYGGVPAVAAAAVTFTSSLVAAAAVRVSAASARPSSVL